MNDRPGRLRRGYSHRPWRFTEKLTLAVLVLIVVAGLALLIRWDMSRECVRWATRIESTGLRHLPDAGVRGVPLREANPQPAMTDRLGRLLLVTLEAARLRADAHPLPALRSWLDSWAGIGHVAIGMHRQGFDLQLTQYDERAGGRRSTRRGWRALADERDGHRVGAYAVAPIGRRS